MDFSLVWLKRRNLLFHTILCGILAGTGTSAGGSRTLPLSFQNFNDGDSFDFIVVGGGLSGCVVAARLAEGGLHSVLLIESGGLPPKLFDIPARSMDAKLWENPDLIKVYPSVPQENAGRYDNGTIHFEIGRMLGGGSSVNDMYFNRGNPEDFNNWARLVKDDSWSYANLLKYFNKMENYTVDMPSDQRGFDGPITVSQPGYTPGLNEWLQGGSELGFAIRDPNGPQTESFNRMDSNRRRGRRVSAFKGYIQPMLDKIEGGGGVGGSKLTILIHTEVNRIIFEGNRATGVNFTREGRRESARARKEIIVCAGVMDSPLLLMRSGIGPGEELSRAGIPVVKELPVGHNLQDHVLMVNPVIFGNSSAVFDPKRDLTKEAWARYKETGEGPYSSHLGSGGQAFAMSSVVTPRDKSLGWNDLHLCPAHTPIALETFGTGTETMPDPQGGEVAAGWLSLFTRPKSRGTLRLDPNGIDNPPVIDFRYLSNPDDMRATIYGVKLLAKLCENTTAFQEIGCRLPRKPLRTCSHLEYRSNPYWECYVRETSMSAFQAAGTCRMGRGGDDPEAVVDSQLRVVGVKGLRVADASIMPVISNALSGVVFLIAEKAADMILQTWEGKA